ncbi:MAG: hypothetical protein E6Q59_01770 [Nitrosomonas sp.]|nr:MAG: hypothetical protein E6Q59_01770 [Nitrosomonas sp.]
MRFLPVLAGWREANG